MWSGVSLDQQKDPLTVRWVVPENIHTHTMGGISEFQRGGGVTLTGIPRTWGGVTSTGIPRTWGGSLEWNSKGIRGFQESNFQFGVVVSSRKTRRKRFI